MATLTNVHIPNMRILITLLVCMMGTSAYADFSVENADSIAIRYRYINDNYDAVVANDNNFRNLYAGHVVIPEEITYNDITSKVVAIDNHAFYLCPDLTSVTIPESVTSIGDNAFNGCSGLTTISIPDGVTEISGGMFSGCSSLTEITIPDSVTSIGANAFQYCSSLTSLTIPSHVTSIGIRAFDLCNSLTSVLVLCSPTSIPENTGLFVTCNELKEVTFDCETVVPLCDVARTLETVTLTDKVKEIRPLAFAGCLKLSSITLPEGLTAIYDDTFNGCQSLTSINIPSSVGYIGDRAVA